MNNIGSLRIPNPMIRYLLGRQKDISEETELPIYGKTAITVKIRDVLLKDGRAEVPVVLKFLKSGNIQQIKVILSDIGIKTDILSAHVSLRGRLLITVLNALLQVFIRVLLPRILATVFERKIEIRFRGISGIRLDLRPFFPEEMSSHFSIKSFAVLDGLSLEVEYTD